MGNQQLTKNTKSIIHEKNNDISDKRFKFLYHNMKIEKFGLFIEKIKKSDQELKYEFINYLSIIKEKEVLLYNKKFKEIRDYYRSELGVCYPKYGSEMNKLYNWSSVVEQLINIINDAKEYGKCDMNSTYSRISENKSLVTEIMEFEFYFMKKNLKFNF